MYYFGEFGEKPADEVIKHAKRQKMADNFIQIIFRPINFLARNGAKAIASSNFDIVSEEQLTKALILQTLKDYNLAPQSRFEGEIRRIITDVLRENNLLNPHPHWKTTVAKRKRHRSL